MATKPEFQRLEKLATNLLLKQNNFKSLDIDVRSLIYDYPIVFDSIQHYCEVTKSGLNKVEIECLNNGYTLVFEKGYLILYNEEHSPERINWTLAHEVGHVYAGHTKDGEKEEIEAHFFAAQLLMPEAIIRKLMHEFGFLDYGWIYSHFYVSLHAAMKRVITLSKKYYTKDRNAMALQNKFKGAIQNTLINFWHNSDQFHLDILHAHALVDEMETPYKECFMLQEILYKEYKENLLYFQ